MHVVLVKDGPLGKAGQTVAVNPTQGRILIQTGHARPQNWRESIVRK